MNRIATLYLSALFCISVCVRGKREIYSQISEAYFEEIHVGGSTSSRTFNEGDVYLYELIDDQFGVARKSLYYKVGDNSGISRQFLMDEHTTIVTKNRVTIYDFPWKVTISTLDGKPFEFYQKLFPLALGNFSDEFPVKQIYQGLKPLDRVRVIKAKRVKFGGWMFAALNDNTPPSPRLIFPVYGLESISMRGPDNEVSLALRTREATPITIEFADSAVAGRFYELVEPLVEK